MKKNNEEKITINQRKDDGISMKIEEQNNRSEK